MSTTMSEKPDINEMRVIHRVFRRELTALPGLVRRVPDGDTARAEVVGHHAQFMLNGLHVHHTGEDEYLWPLLLERARRRPSWSRPCRLSTSRCTSTSTAPSTCWSAGAVRRARGAGEALAAEVERLDAALFEHLDQEEREILPLAEQHVTVAEWARLGEHGRGSMSRADLPIMFGAILEEADPAERAPDAGAPPGPGPAPHAHPRRPHLPPLHLPHRVG